MDAGSRKEPWDLSWVIVFSTGSEGEKRGIKKTAVIPTKITRKYWISRGMRYRFMNDKNTDSSVFYLPIQKLSFLNGSSQPSAISFQQKAFKTKIWLTADS
jgi:hypothetical protein